MKKNWLNYGLAGIVVLAFVLLWVAVGDPLGAFLSLVVLALGVGLVAAVLGYLVSNAPAWFRGLRGISWEDYLKQLESNGEAVREEYRATGALTAEELNTSSLVHFVDVGGGRILCLYGQQYFDFEPIEDDPEVNQPRHFPTRDFALLRHLKRNEVLCLFPGSDVFEPIVCEPIRKLDRLFDLGFKLRDGEIVTGASLKAVEHALKGST